LFVLIAFFAAWAASRAFAAQLGFVSDTVTDSQPSVVADHAIAFQLSDAVPASGAIAVGFEGTPFAVDPAFDYTYADLAYSVSSRTSGFVERDLAAVPDATHDGLAANSPTGPIVITMSSGSGIPAGAYVRLVLGNGGITNPSSTGAYRADFDTYSATGTKLDYGATILTILPAVGVSANTDKVNPPVITNALPSGTIPSNVTGVVLSLNTDTFATCRYATTTGVSYDAMTNTFDHTALGTFHTAEIDGAPVNGTTYHFYVRCIDYAGNKDATDFDLSYTAGNPTGTGSGGGTGGSSGGGGGGGGGPTYPPYPPGPSEPSLVIQGIALPGERVSVLEDGVAISESALTDGNGNFSITIPSLPQGTYSFTLYINDNSGNRLSARTMTMTVISGSANSVQGIVLPPSLALATTTVPVGGTLAISGNAEPSSTVTLSVTSQSDAQSPVTVTVPASASGAWTYTLHTTGFAVDTYQVRAESAVPGLAVSGFSGIAYLGIGTTPQPKAAVPDLNGDGKVNLIDFSILLFHWGQAYPPADLNFDGTVDLPDFSILLFHWTG